jgi:hypothetical protein
VRPGEGSPLPVYTQFSRHERPALYFSSLSQINHPRDEGSGSLQPPLVEFTVGFSMSVQRFEPFVVLSKILEVRDYAFSEILLGK